MPTHKVLCDLDVGGEVKGTSLDINGNADISGTTAVGGTVLGTSAKFGRDAHNLIDFSADDKVTFRVGNADEITLAPNEFSPTTSDGIALGTGTKMWSDLFLASGSVINFNNGDVTMTHSSNQVTIAGGTLFFTFGNGNYNTVDGTTILDSEDNDLISFSEAAVTFSATNVSIGGTLNVAADIVHVGDTDTKIGFSTDSVRVTCGNVVAVTHAATGSTMAKRTFAKTGTTDGDVIGDVVYFGGTTSMTTGAIYHYKSDGTWELADADSAANCDGLLGVALGSASDTNGVLLRGMVTLDHDPGAVGDVLFLSTTAGDATATAPSGNGDIVRVIGYCLDASNGQIFFNPDGTFVEVTA
jgi:hypothetical protein